MLKASILICLNFPKLQELKHQMGKDSENIQKLGNENKSLEREIDRLIEELSSTKCKVSPQKTLSIRKI